MSNDTKNLPPNTDTLHTCSYACERPGCIRAQRDYLAARLAAVEADRQRRGEPVAWPLASPEEAAKGWILDYRFIEQVERIASQRTNYTTSMEATEQVLIAANEVLRASSQPAVSGYTCTVPDDCETLHWRGQILSMNELVPEAQPAEQHLDDAAVDRFAAAMKDKLAKKRSEGRSGWQSMTSEQLSALLHEHVRKDDPVDVANLAMMLHQNGQTIEPPTTREAPPNDPLQGIEYREDGEANFYTLSKPGGNWLARIQFNGELRILEQERLLEAMLGDRNVRYGDGYHDGYWKAKGEAPDVEALVGALREEIERLLDSREREGDRLDWLLARLPGDVIRDLVGEMNCPSDVAEWRYRIDKAARFNPRPGEFGG